MLRKFSHNFHVIYLLLFTLSALEATLAVNYTVTNNASTTQAGMLFTNKIGNSYALKTLSNATNFIWQIFQQTKDSDRKSVDQVDLIIVPGPNPDIVGMTPYNQIQFNAEYLARYSGDIKIEFTGVIYYEMTRVWQWDGNGQANAGLIEGIADYVRLKAGYIANGWAKPGDGSNWDEGYSVTTRFLDYCDGLRSGFVAQLNKKMKDGYSDDFFQDLLGKNVNQLWADYLANYVSPPSTNAPKTVKVTLMSPSSSRRRTTIGDIVECGNQAFNYLCANGQCCNEFGHCGTTSAYCGTGCQSQCSGGGGPASSPSTPARNGGVSPSSTPPTSNSTRKGAETVILSPSSAPSQNSGNNKRLKVIAIVTTVSGIAILVAIVYFLCRRKAKQDKRHNTSLDFLEGKPSLNKFEELPLFKFEKLSAATNNFHESNKLGQGGFGLVYKGTLEDGQEVAIKRLSGTSRQGAEEFMNEVLVISMLQHRNLVKLLGCCVERQERMLIYDYMPNRSLDAFLFDPQKKGVLDWKKRYTIIEGISRRLLYLHQDSRLKIIHRDLKATNILLDENLNPKISDFGTARIFGGTQIEADTTRVVGTYGVLMATCPRVCN